MSSFRPSKRGRYRHFITVPLLQGIGCIMHSFPHDGSFRVDIENEDFWPSLVLDFSEFMSEIFDVFQGR